MGHPVSPFFRVSDHHRPDNERRTPAENMAIIKIYGGTQFPRTALDPTPTRILKNTGCAIIHYSYVTFISLLLKLRFLKWPQTFGVIFHLVWHYGLFTNNAYKKRWVGKGALSLHLLMSTFHTFLIFQINSENEYISRNLSL